MHKTVLLLALLAFPAYAAPPPGADPSSEIAAWVHTLADYQGHGCCDLADCRPTVFRVTATGQVEVWIGIAQFGPWAPDDWLPVKREVIEGTTSKGPAPDAHTWACYYGGEVKCLRPGGGM